MDGYMMVDIAASNPATHIILKQDKNKEELTHTVNFLGITL